MLRLHRGGNVQIRTYASSADHTFNAEEDTSGIVHTRTYASSADHAFNAEEDTISLGFSKVTGASLVSICFLALR